MTSLMVLLVVFITLFGVIAAVMAESFLRSLLGRGSPADDWRGVVFGFSVVMVVYGARRMYEPADAWFVACLVCALSAIGVYALVLVRRGR